IRRITKIALVCKKYAMMANFLVDMFIEAINVAPNSVGSGEAIRRAAKDIIKYFRTKLGTLFCTYWTIFSFESFLTSSLKPCLIEWKMIRSLSKEPTPAINPAINRFCSLA
ncbi:MAG: hypothetical protein QXR63_05380, partial [Candidatus Bathyarchaeia archaeon]